MKRSVWNLLVVVGSLMTSTFAFAQGEGSGTGMWAIGSGLAMGLAALGGTLGQGKAASSALEGITRNPNAKDAAFTPLIIALALIEFQAIMGFIVAFLWYSK